jgi:hypothetical protein
VGFKEGEMRTKKVKVTGVWLYKPQPWSSLPDCTEFAQRPSDGVWFSRGFHWSGGSNVLPYRWSRMYAGHQQKLLDAAGADPDKVVYIPAEGTW